MATESKHLSTLSLPVIVAALGYFVDIYDLILFGIVRVASLKELGLEGEALTEAGAYLLNMQMGGMLLGGILWGVMGDKRGRLSVLFGSIILYSVANFLNGFVTSIEQYALLRFMAGVGLAGELGAGVTLVAELLPPHQRGYGTMVIAGVGVTGAVAANLIASVFDWRMAYMIGGGLGFGLLLLRVGLTESGMFASVRRGSVVRGNFFALFTKKELFSRYAKAIGIGIPLWYIVGILILFSPEFAKALGIVGEVKAGEAVMYCYIGLAIGDFASGYLSQKLRSRRKAVFAFLILSAVGVVGYLVALQGAPAWLFYAVSLYLGIAAGYWAVFITVAAEQFGTNLRATVATTVPNFVRGMVIPITSLFIMLKGAMGILGSAAVVGFISFLLAFLALARLEETYHKNLDYIEI
ncbi:MAG: MFS transporter [Campylobacterales bacterium]